jgi:mitochondrial fission protein ELM1
MAQESRFDPRPACWVVTDGAAGAENQCLGLAEALGFEPEVKRIRVRAPWRWLPPGLWLNPIAALSGEGDPLRPPWPRVLIASGRKAAAPALAVRKITRGGTFTVQIQDPRVPPDEFDVIVAPRHDGVRGDNVVPAVGALTRITKARLDAAAARFAPMVAELPAPRVAVLVGGRSKAYNLSTRTARRLGRDLVGMMARTGAGVMMTTSRRTPPEAATALREALAGQPAVVWQAGRDSGENPYFGFLALADHIVVTADSVNMASEAATTGKPVHVVELEGGRGKFRDFHAQLRDLGIARPFDGRLEAWSYAPLDETRRVAALVRERLEDREARRERTRADLPASA